ncbi:transcriptional regulator family: HMG [Paecilomyces variotii]|nr:transcriptional regulator family: HMG [Paecilomyces variotii]
MADLAAILQELDMAQYLPSFIHNGFESWADVLDITEYDLDALGVKLGHRRRLQQRVARERGLPPTPHGLSRSGTGTEEMAARSKRRYRWHPKADPNAPKKPLTAYAQFANEKRRELQHRGLSFADMAIEIGKLWRELLENEKRDAQARAIKARDDYKEALAAYKTTEEHRRYEMYLKEWKARKCARKTSVAESVNLNGYNTTDQRDGDLESTSPSTDARSARNYSEDGTTDIWLAASNDYNNPEAKFVPPALGSLSMVPTVSETVWWASSQPENIWDSHGGVHGGINATADNIESPRGRQLSAQYGWVPNVGTDGLMQKAVQH